MNAPESSNRGRVVPKWLEFSKTLTKGELVIPGAKPIEINEYTEKKIAADLTEFRHAPSVKSALVVLGDAIVIGDEETGREMATFIKKQKGAGEASHKLADKILNSEKNIRHVAEINLHIADLRNWLKNYPRSAVSWIQLSRLYTITGQFSKAERAAIVALNLAPYDRYVVRCGVRLFLHIRDFDSAWHYIHKANLHVHDPWLKATEINVAMIANKVTPSFLKILPGDLAGVDLFHYSELFESYGVLEINRGNVKHAKKLFRTAWTKPCETVISHGEWVIRNMLPGLKEYATLEYEKSLEALTWVKYIEFDLKSAMKAAKEWELEEPYSRSPFILGTSIACGAGLPDMGAEIAKRGLISNPDDQRLINNLTYALLRSGRVEEAAEVHRQLRDGETDDFKIYFRATKGLLEFKKGNMTEGRNLYLDALRLCKQQGNKVLAAKAQLNLSLAELEASTTEAERAAQTALSMSENLKEPDIELMKRQVIEKLLKKRDSAQKD